MNSIFGELDSILEKKNSLLPYSIYDLSIEEHKERYLKLKKQFGEDFISIKNRNSNNTRVRFMHKINIPDENKWLKIDGNTEDKIGIMYKQKEKHVYPVTEGLEKFIGLQNEIKYPKEELINEMKRCAKFLGDIEKIDYNIVKRTNSVKRILIKNKNIQFFEKLNSENGISFIKINDIFFKIYKNKLLSTEDINSVLLPELEHRKYR